MNIIIRDQGQEPTPRFNCGNPGTCPLGLQYMIKSVIYEVGLMAALDGNTTDKKTYARLCEVKFKNRNVNYMSAL